MLLLGVGVGGTFPILGAAAVTTAPPAVFAVAGAVTQTARQLGGALGIAVVIALLDRPVPTDAASAFESVWAFGTASAALAAGVALALPRPARPARLLPAIPGPAMPGKAA